MKYVSIDIETTGLDPETCQVLQVGAVIEDTEQVLPIDQLPRFNCIVENQSYTGSPYALWLNSNLLKKLGDMESLKKDERLDYRKANNILPVGTVAASFNIWLIANGFTQSETGGVTINVAGKNFASFDKQFLVKLPNWTSKIQMRQRIMDPAILFMDWTNDSALPNLNSCLQRAQLAGEVTHDAVDDAIDVVRVIRAATSNYQK
jgi:DNA polymerase III alpha subunit (gram-positive type)